jgi:hypothetical protein
MSKGCAKCNEALMWKNHFNIYKSWYKDFMGREILIQK